jgi:hypothetical protein
LKTVEFSPSIEQERGMTVDLISHQLSPLPRGGEEIILLLNFIKISICTHVFYFN